MNIEAILQQIDQYFMENKGKEAEKLLLSSVEEAEKQQDKEAKLSLCNELLGYYRESSQVEKAFETAEGVCKLLEEMGIQNTIAYATSLLNVANAYRAGGKYEASLQYYQRVQEIYERELTRDNILVASLENNRSLLYQEMGDFRQAKACLLKALSIVKEKEAEFEMAVTYANLASTCIQLGENKEAYSYAVLAEEEFQKMGIRDAHYAAALAAKGSYWYRERDYVQAKGYYEEAVLAVEEKLGQNEYVRRLQENIALCEEKLAPDTGKECCKGLRLCREYYEVYGKPMIEQQFPEYVDRIAVGLAGEGSDCLGYDDEISQDHDWGPSFCMWVTAETYAEIGEELEQAYANLPVEFQGYTRTVSPQGAGRRGVVRIDQFYERLLQASEWEKIQWREVSDASLAAAVSGEVFVDAEGIFTEFRKKLQKGYSEEMQYLKLAEAAARFSQAGQYNYNRMRKRGDRVTAQLMTAEALREAMKLQYYIEGKYPPHDKWLYTGLNALSGGETLKELVCQVEQAGKQEEKVSALWEQIAVFLVTELYQRHFISDMEPYLDAHTAELLTKASVAGDTNAELVDKIVSMEFMAFDKVRNVGGRASCQNDWATFSIMRKSQYMTWNRTMLLQYYYDFKREYEKNHNLVEEKYGRMMESTAPDEYENWKEYFPVLTPQKQEIIQSIVEIQVNWMEEFAVTYPHLAENARSIRSEEDYLYNTSYETYLRGEISTYSDKMLELYGRYVVEYANLGKNLAYEIMKNNVHLYGYRDLEAAEDFLA